jgi:FKBP-type peptidyl-prolyl cis-trans isomerase FkpA
MLSGLADSMRNKVPDDTGLLQKYGPQLNEILSQRASKTQEGEKSKGHEFIESYLSKNPAASKLSSGLVVHERVKGTGKQASLDSTVLVHYHGTLISGQVFDSSVDRGEPIKFPLKNVIQGWQEGVALMKEGGKMTLVVPSDLAYGDRGSPPVIGPGATLVFEVELLQVL